MNEGLHVIMVSAFYRDNEPGGIATGLQFESPTSGVEFCRMMENVLPVYDTLALEDVLAELRRLGARRHELTHDECDHVILCIHWMQRRGHLTPDEYNGTMFAGVLKDTVFSSERNPVAMDVAAATTGKGAVDITDVVTASKAVGYDKGLTAAIRALVDHARSRP